MGFSCRILEYYCTKILCHFGFEEKTYWRTMYSWLADKFWKHISITDFSSPIMPTSSGFWINMPRRIHPLASVGIAGFVTLPIMAVIISSFYFFNTTTTPNQVMTVAKEAQKGVSMLVVEGQEKSENNDDDDSKNSLVKTICRNGYRILSEGVAKLTVGFFAIKNYVETGDGFWHTRYDNKSHASASIDSSSTKTSVEFVTTVSSLSELQKREVEIKGLLNRCLESDETLELKPNEGHENIWFIRDISTNSVEAQLHVDISSQHIEFFHRDKYYELSESEKYLPLFEHIALAL